ncbi:MAG: hypothetical protein ACTHN8_01635 [Angustibacter sp.]
MQAEQPEVMSVGRLRKPLLWIVIAFFVYAVFKSPDQAASIVKGGWAGLGDGARAVGNFFDALLAG